MHSNGSLNSKREHTIKGQLKSYNTALGSDQIQSYMLSNNRDTDNEALLKMFNIQQ